ncbi:MAG: FdhF/YdeP family oxidoreductase [Armatimonadetes bacterium]|nr:FdhF/YdeP family oxidoreductase [Armatimonadota bacterium]
MRARRSGGGFAALSYSLKKARDAGGFLKMYRALRSRNACKTCALGMGGQKGGMVNERGQFPEVCKKSIQAMAADMQGRVPQEFFEEFDLEQLKRFSPRQLEAAGRLVEPMYAGPDDEHYRTISWDDALDKVADQLKKTEPKESFFYFSGRSSNEAGFLLQLVARLYGTNHVSNCSYYCHQASGVALSSVTGSGTATIVLEDLAGCDLIFLIGANPASNHPRLMRTMVELRRRGGKVIVVNPLREVGLERFRVPSDVRSMLFGSKTCDLYVQPHAGGDIAFLAGVAKATIELGAESQEFVEQFAEDWEPFRDHVIALSWDEIVAAGGVDRETIEQVASIYAQSEKTVFCWAMGITHHEHGVGNVQMIANLAMTRGMLGRPNCGLLPLRGHSNVQGIGSMGVVPKMKKQVFERLQTHFGVSIPSWKGLDTLGSIAAAAEGKMRTAWCLGGNLYGSNPDAAFAHSALSKLDQIVYLSTALNTGHALGRGKETIILPVLARDEEQQSTTQESMFSFVRLSDGGPQRLRGPRSEVSVIADVAERVFGNTTPVDWTSLRQHGKIRAAIAAIIPGYEKIASIDKTKKEFQIEGRTFHEPRFPTESGRAKFHVVPLPSAPDGLRMITVRSEGQFNTVVYEEEDAYRGQKRRDVVMMHPSDIAQLGFSVGQLAEVSSEIGSMTATVREIDVRPGTVVMYYPEANAIIPRRADPASRTPAFKSTPVSIARAGD